MLQLLPPQHLLQCLLLCGFFFFFLLPSLFTVSLTRAAITFILFFCLARLSTIICEISESSLHHIVASTVTVVYTPAVGPEKTAI